MGNMPESFSNGEVAQLQDKVEVFARAARVGNKVGTVCGDGGVTKEVRTTKGETVEVGGFAGDLGQDLATVFAIAAYNLRHNIEFDPKDLVGQVAAQYIKHHGQFQMHTAGHIHPPDRITDCGDVHGKMSVEFAQAYGLTPEIGRMIVESAQAFVQADEVGEFQEQDLGNREHEELGVLVVEGKTHSLVHWLPRGEASGMWFVLDPDRARARRKAVLEHMSYSPVQVDEILTIKMEQDFVTNRRLALGKHVFGVNVDDPDNIRVHHLGQIQSDGRIK